MIKHTQILMNTYGKTQGIHYLHQQVISNFIPAKNL